MFVIGIDPHKGSHTAAVLDDSEELVGELRVNADRRQRDRLLRFAAPFEPRTWAVEAAGGLGALLAQQLVAAGEMRRRCATDAVGAGAAARLGSDRQDRPARRPLRRGRRVATRPAASGPTGRSLRGAAPVGEPSPRPHRVADPDDLPAPRPAVPADPGRFERPFERPTRRPGAARSSDRSSSSTSNASASRSSSSPTCAASTTNSTPLVKRIAVAVVASGTTVTDVYGIGPIVAAFIVGHTGDVDPVPDRRALRPLQRHRPDRSIIRTASASPAQPAREPAAQPRVAHRRGHPDRARHPRPRLLRPQARRGQDPQRSAPRAEAPHQRRRLPPARRRHPTLTSKGPGGQTGTTPKASVAGSTP